MTTPSQAAHIRDLMRSVVEDVVIFPDLAAFAKEARNLEGAVVWPHWNGSRNRNRTAHVAALCDIMGLAYVGPDPYARLVANDKSLSKVYLERCGLKSPPSVFVANARQANQVGSLAMPVIVKPNMEGSSIGIDQSSICNTEAEARALTVKKLETFPEGIIVEEFVRGPEVFISLAFNARGTFCWGCSERVVHGDAKYLTDHVYDYNLKFSGQRRITLRPFEFVSPELLTRIIQLTEDLKTIDLIRIDGRISNGELLILEMTPDPLMTPHSEFLGTLAQAGHEPRVVIRDIIERTANRRERHGTWR